MINVMEAVDARMHGKEVQWRSNENHDWQDADEVLPVMLGSTVQYRIKPETNQYVELGSTIDAVAAFKIGKNIQGRKLYQRDWVDIVEEYMLNEYSVYRIKPFAEVTSVKSHVHADLIKRWVDDTSLIILFNRNEGWFKSHNQVLPKWLDYNKYFLVCEKHVEVALHWLNNGEIETSDGDDWFTVKPVETHPCAEVLFNEQHEYRIKPSTETLERIALLKNTLTVQIQSIDELTESNTVIIEELNALSN